MHPTDCLIQCIFELNILCAKNCLISYFARQHQNRNIKVSLISQERSVNSVPRFLIPKLKRPRLVYQFCKILLPAVVIFFLTEFLIYFYDIALVFPHILGFDKFREFYCGIFIIANSKDRNIEQETQESRFALFWSGTSFNPFFLFNL